MASCCCSPPESLPAVLARRPRAGKRSIGARCRRDLVPAGSRRAEGSRGSPRPSCSRRSAGPRAPARSPGRPPRARRPPATRRRSDVAAGRWSDEPTVAAASCLAGAVRSEEADDLARRHRERRRPDRGDPAVADDEAVDLERRRRQGARDHPRRRRLAEVGGDDVGVAADLGGRAFGERRPWSSTWMRSQTRMTSAMLWSISSTPAAWSRAGADDAASRTSAVVSPAAGSSSSTNRGSVASARATPRRRSSPWASPPAFGVARQAEPLEQPRAAPRLARARAGAERATSTFSRTVRLAEHAAGWNVRASPCRPRRCRVQR